MKVDWKVSEIERRIPHRPPFRLIDGVQWFEARRKARGYLFIDPANPVFEGHFPGNPIFPGVLILEALGQLGAILFEEPATDGRTPSSSGRYFARMDRVRFLRPVHPGARLDLEVDVLKIFGIFAKIQATASVKGDKVTTAELTFTIGEDTSTPDD